MIEGCDHYFFQKGYWGVDGNGDNQGPMLECCLCSEIVKPTWLEIKQGKYEEVLVKI